MAASKIDIKAALSRLSFLRNHLNMLVPIIIAIISIVPFVLGQMVGGKLRQQVQSNSLSQARTLESLADTAVSDRQWEAVRDAMHQYVQDANQIERLVRQTTMRPLLSYHIFPQPEDDSQLLFDNFAKQYLQGIEQMILGVGGRDAPSEAELKDNTGAGDSTMGLGGEAGYGPDMGMGEDYGGEEGYGAEEGYGGEEGYGMFGMGQTRKIVDAICTERAMSSHVYVDPEKVPGYRFWSEWEFENVDYALEDCWTWQLGYWIVEDVFDTIRTCNEGASNVFTSPVKRLKEVRFNRISQLGLGGDPSGYDMMYMTEGESSSEGEVGPKILRDKAQAIAKPLTDRITDDDVDVVQFSVSVIVDARRVLWFMEQLCSEKEHVFRGFSGNEPAQRFKRNQITILEAKTRSFPRKVGRHRLYRYGNDPVVELTLVCEYLFNKAGYQDVVPEVVENAASDAEAAN